MSREHFNRIKVIYGDFTRELLRKGRLPLRSTSKGFWNPASDDEVYEAFRQLGLGKYKRFLDIGSGDGRVVMIASLFGPKAEGVEIDEELHGIALEMQKKLGTTAMFHCKDVYAHDLSGYDVLFLNPDAPMERGMENKLLAEMQGHLMLYGHHFHPQFMQKKAAIEVNGTPVTVYAKYPRR
jgi:hypothetical protein